MGLPRATADAVSVVGMVSDARAPADFTGWRAMIHTLRVVLLFTAGTAIACGGGDSVEGGSPGETNRGAVAPTPPAPGSGDAGQITPDMVALGNEVFHGRRANGICYTCHGMDATGGAGGLGPNLTDDEWLHGDGSYDAITGTIRTGVPQPVSAPAPMPPMGGASLSEKDLRAVAAYVYSLSHQMVGRQRGDRGA